MPGAYGQGSPYEREMERRGRRAAAPPIPWGQPLRPVKVSSASDPPPVAESNLDTPSSRRSLVPPPRVYLRALGLAPQDA